MFYDSICTEIKNSFPEHSRYKNKTKNRGCFESLRLQTTITLNNAELEYYITNIGE